jgi:predicted Zn-dependent protease
MPDRPPHFRAYRLRCSNSRRHAFNLRKAQWGRAEALEKLSRHAEAVRDWDRAIEREEGPNLPQFRLMRALALARGGDPGTAVTELKDLAEAKNATPLTLYNLACGYALVSAVVKDEPARAAAYAARAVELLARANAAGYFKDAANVEHLKKNRDLNSLRSREDFRKLLAELAKARPTER